MRTYLALFLLLFPILHLFPPLPRVVQKFGRIHFTTLFICDTFRITFRLHNVQLMPLPLNLPLPPNVYIFLIWLIELLTGTKCSTNIDTFCVFSKFVCTPNWVRQTRKKTHNCRYCGANNYNNHYNNNSDSTTTTQTTETTTRTTCNGNKCATLCKHCENGDVLMPFCGPINCSTCA